jgi:transposase
MSRPLFVRAMTRQENEELRRCCRSCEDARLVRRAQVVRLSGRGNSPSQIADLLELSYSGVTKIIRRFNRESFASLADKPRAGRPRKTTERYVALLKTAVRADPRDLRYPFGCWTLERLREHLERKTHILLSRAHLSRLLAENDIVYRRPKHGMAHLRDPQEYDEKKAFLDFVKKGRFGHRPALPCSTSMNVRFTSTRP